MPSFLLDATPDFGGGVLLTEGDVSLSYASKVTVPIVGTVVGSFLSGRTQRAEGWLAQNLVLPAGVMSHSHSASVTLYTRYGVMRVTRSADGAYEMRTPGIKEVVTVAAAADGSGEVDLGSMVEVWRVDATVLGTFYLTRGAVVVDSIALTRVPSAPAAQVHIVGRVGDGTLKPIDTRAAAMGSTELAIENGESIHELSLLFDVATPLGLSQETVVQVRFVNALDSSLAFAARTGAGKVWVAFANQAPALLWDPDVRGSQAVDVDMDETYAVVAADNGTAWVLHDDLSSEQVSGITDADRVRTTGGTAVAFRRGGNSYRAWGANANDQTGIGYTNVPASNAQWMYTPPIQDIQLSNASVIVMDSIGFITEIYNGSLFPIYFTSGPFYDGPAVAIASGAETHYALLSNGKVISVGSGQYGQLGDGTNDTAGLAAWRFVKNVDGTNFFATEIQARYMNAAARGGDGKWFAWGRNLSGSLALESQSLVSQNVAYPVSNAAYPSGTDPSDVSLSMASHASLFFSDSTVTQFKDNASQLWPPLQNGSIVLDPQGEPARKGVVTVTGRLPLPSRGTVSMKHMAGYFRDPDEVRLLDYALGSAAGYTQGMPVGVPNVVDVAAGSHHVVVVMADGTLRAWGENAHGQLGDGTTTDRYRPVKVRGVSSAKAVACGDNHSLVLLQDGRVMAWGSNGNGRLGDGTLTTHLTPVYVYGVTTAVAISAGSAHTMALLAGGQVMVWGSNSRGQLGDMPLVDQSYPIQRFSGVSGIACGSEHSAILYSNGTVASFGRNDYGQLGVGDTTDRSSPVSVGVSGAVAVAAGSFHTMAILSNGAAQAWGRNDLGQLGNGTNINRSSPVTVPGITSAAKIYGGGNRSLVILSSGAVLEFGDTSLTEEVTFQNTPVAVSGISGVVDASVGDKLSVFLDGEGSVLTAGKNTSGQLGTGGASSAVAASPSPVNIEAVNELALSIFQGKEFPAPFDGPFDLTEENPFMVFQRETDGEYAPVILEDPNLVVNSAGGPIDVAVLDNGGVATRVTDVGGRKALAFTHVYGDDQVFQVRVRIKNRWGRSLVKVLPVKRLAAGPLLIDDLYSMDVPLVVNSQTVTGAHGSPSDFNPFTIDLRTYYYNPILSTPEVKSTENMTFSVDETGTNLPSASAWSFDGNVFTYRPDFREASFQVLFKTSTVVGENTIVYAPKELTLEFQEPAAPSPRLVASASQSTSISHGTLYETLNLASMFSDDLGTPQGLTYTVQTQGTDTRLVSGVNTNTINTTRNYPGATTSFVNTSLSTLYYINEYRGTTETVSIVAKNRFGKTTSRTVTFTDPTTTQPTVVTKSKTFGINDTPTYRIYLSDLGVTDTTGKTIRIASTTNGTFGSGTRGGSTIISASSNYVDIHHDYRNTTKEFYIYITNEINNNPLTFRVVEPDLPSFTYGTYAIYWRYTNFQALKSNSSYRLYDPVTVYLKNTTTDQRFDNSSGFGLVDRTLRSISLSATSSNALYSCNVYNGSSPYITFTPPKNNVNYSLYVTCTDAYGRTVSLRVYVYSYIISGPTQIRGSQFDGMYSDSSAYYLYASSILTDPYDSNPSFSGTMTYYDGSSRVINYSVSWNSTYAYFEILPLSSYYIRVSSFINRHGISSNGGNFYLSHNYGSPLKYGNGTRVTNSYGSAMGIWVRHRGVMSSISAGATRYASGTSVTTTTKWLALVSSLERNFNGTIPTKWRAYVSGDSKYVELADANNSTALRVVVTYNSSRGGVVKSSKVDTSYINYDTGTRTKRGYLLVTFYSSGGNHISITVESGNIVADGARSLYNIAFVSVTSDHYMYGHQITINTPSHSISLDKIIYPFKRYQLVHGYSSASFSDPQSDQSMIPVIPGTNQYAGYGNSSLYNNVTDSAEYRGYYSNIGSSDSYYETPRRSNYWWTGGNATTYSSYIRLTSNTVGQEGIVAVNKTMYCGLGGTMTFEAKVYIDGGADEVALIWATGRSYSKVSDAYNNTEYHYNPYGTVLFGSYQHYYSRLRLNVALPSPGDTSYGILRDYGYDEDASALNNGQYLIMRLHIHREDSTRGTVRLELYKSPGENSQYVSSHTLTYAGGEFNHTTWYPFIYGRTGNFHADQRVYGMNFYSDYSSSY